MANVRTIFCENRLMISIVENGDRDKQWRSRGKYTEPTAIGLDPTEI
jgi:hypothetical protein